MDIKYILDVRDDLSYEYDDEEDMRNQLAGKILIDVTTHEDISNNIKRFIIGQS